MLARRIGFLRPRQNNERIGRSTTAACRAGLRWALRLRAPGCVFAATAACKKKCYFVEHFCAESSATCGANIVGEGVHVIKCKYVMVAFLALRPPL